MKLLTSCRVFLIILILLALAAPVYSDYCSATGGAIEYISGVEVGDISNTDTDQDGYADYTYLSTTMEPGVGYEITVTNGTPFYYNDECGIWVDWNQDEDFYDADEQITVSNSPGIGPYEATITPPENAVAGDTRMRVRITYNQTPSPCGDTAYGEVEDYTITVTGEPQTLKVSGYVTLSNGAPLSGVLLEAYYDIFTPSGLTDISDANGYYEIILDSPWSGYIEPTKDGWDFSWPTHFIDVTTDQIQDFIAYWPYSGGLGISNFPYLIATPNDMNAIGDHPEDWDKHFKLVNDIDLSAYTGTEFNIIGTSASEPFTGVFDGNGHIISNFTYTTTNKTYIGLFGYVNDTNAVIENLKLIDSHVDADLCNDVGTIVGFFKSGVISNCSVENGYVCGEDNTGGLIGRNSGNVSNCYFQGDVIPVRISIYYTGGLIGLNEGLVNSCYTQGTVKGDTSGGGLVGANFCGNVSNCYSKSNVSGVWAFAVPLGGLVGENVGSPAIMKQAIISDCFSIGRAPNGLVGFNATSHMGHVYNSFWDIQSSQTQSSSGGTGLTTAEMQTASTFIDAGWDFVDIWTICEGTNYPRLQWQILLPADFLCPEGVDFLDYTYFSNYWLETDCALSSDCNGTDFDISGTVDSDDLKFFTDFWLTGL